jgi:hypothetical protein
MTTFSIRDLQERYKVTEHTVLAWIYAGDLKALNVGRNQGNKKPRWRITKEAIEQFELTRMHSAPVPTVRKRRQSAVPQIYK